MISVFPNIYPDPWHSHRVSMMRWTRPGPGGDDRALVRRQNTKQAKLTQSLHRTDLAPQTQIRTSIYKNNNEVANSWIFLDQTKSPANCRLALATPGAGGETGSRMLIIIMIRSQSVIISSRPFFSLLSRNARRSPCPRPRSPRLVKTHQSLDWGGDGPRGNLSKLARIVSSSSA